MSRRGNGEGTIGKRSDGRWEARYVDQDGRRRSLFTRTRQEAQERLREALRARDRGITPTHGTVGAYLRAWLEGTRLTVRQRTHQGYEQLVRDHLIPGLGRVRLERLQPQQVAELYARLSEAGLSAKTVRNVHQCLHRALEQAVSYRVLASNPAHGVQPPRVERAEMQALSPEEARRVLEVAREDPLEALWVLAITAGLRQGELRALRWPDVDLAAARLQVVASMEGRRVSEARPAEPKTRRSRRAVELTAAAVRALGRHRDAQLVAGVIPTAYVFTREDGRPMSGQQLYDRWLRLAQRAGVPVVRFHDLRHTAATLMLGRGVHPKLVSEMLGHSTIAITLDLYSHVTPAMHREAARAMDELLGE